MSHATLELHLESSKNSLKTTAKLDTGFTDYLVINKEVRQKLGIENFNSTEVLYANNTKDIVKTTRLDLIVYLNPDMCVLKNVEVLILENEKDILVGYELLKELEVNGGYKALIDTTQDKVLWLE
jgi:clan AA aspartic protease